MQRDTDSHAGKPFERGAVDNNANDMGALHCYISMIRTCKTIRADVDTGDVIANIIAIMLINRGKRLHRHDENLASAPKWCASADP
jgi:hypothetical protein